MRRSLKGAAAVAALCAGALTMTSLAVADVTNPTEGSGSGATYKRIAGEDRIQTSLEALHEHTGTVNIMIVGYQGVVDALSLAPLAKATGDSVVIYSDRNGLDQRTLSALGSATIGKVFISGGYGAVPVNVFDQLTKTVGVNAADIYRMSGADRFETAYLTGALALDMANGNAKSVGTDLQKVNGIDRANAAFASIKDAFVKAAAEKMAADKAYADAMANEVAAGALVAKELAKYSDGLTAGQARTDAESVASKIADTFKCVAMVNDGVKKMEAVLAYKQNDPKWKDTKIKDAEAAVTPALAQDLKDVLGIQKCDKSGAVVTDDQVSLGKAKDALVQEAASATKSAKTDMDQFVQKQMAAATASAHSAVLADPNSEYGKAAAAYVAAQGATAAAKTRMTKADTAYGPAEQAYINALTQQAKVAENTKERADLVKAVHATMDSGNYRIFLATGMNFADALTAGPAAAAAKDEKGADVPGVVLLTNNNVMPSYVAEAVNASSLDVYGIGGPAANSFAKSIRVVGSDRYDTSAKVAMKFFNAGKGVYALASGETGADAVVAGVYLTSLKNHPAASSASTAEAILLTTKDALPASVADFIQYGDHGTNQKPVETFVVFGGYGVVSAGVAQHAASISEN